MQLNGIGEEHSQPSHQITNCMHSHAAQKSGGGVGAAGGKSVISAEKSPAEQMLLMPGWLQSIRSGGKKLWGRIWGDNSPDSDDLTALSQQAAQNAGVLGKQALNVQDAGLPQNTAMAQNMTEVSELARAAAQSALVPGQAKENPYFMPVIQESREKDGWEKIKIKFQTITKYLSHNFSGKDKFRNGQEGHAKDMSKRSHYQGADVKIECVLTDDSYLLDSYDRRGSYSKLSAKK